MVTVLTLVVIGMAARVAPRGTRAQRRWLRDRWAAGHTLDLDYLAGLSADAVPVLVCLPDRQRGRALSRLSAALAATPDDWRSANVARDRARTLLAVPGPAGCANRR